VERAVKEWTEWKIPDLARELGTTTAYLYKLLRENKLTGRRNERGQWLIPNDVAQAMLAKKRRPAGPPAQAQAQASESYSATHHPARRVTDGTQPEFHFILMPNESAVIAYRKLLAELSSLTDQVVEQLRRLHEIQK